MSMVRVGVRILGAIVLFGLGSQAFVQPPKSVAAAPAAKPERPVDAEPNSTVASFGDWTLRCQIRAQDQQNPMAELAVGRLKEGRSAASHNRCRPISPLRTNRASRLTAKCRNRSPWAGENACPEVALPMHFSTMRCCAALKGLKAEDIARLQHQAQKAKDK